MTLAEEVRAQKRHLDELKTRMVPGGLDGLEQAQRIDITYTSNALEGNTLTAGETALVLEKGITIGGKPLKDHLEAIDHAKAYDWVKTIAAESSAPITETDVRNLHYLVVAQSHAAIAGRCADRARYVNTGEGSRQFPSPTEVPALMGDFCRWLGRAKNEPEIAFEAHRRLLNIHPFNDGNGRTARLLMNLVLLRGGYPPIAVRPADRPAYLAALELAQSGGGDDAFNSLLYKRLNETLDQHIEAARQAARRP